MRNRNMMIHVWLIAKPGEERTFAQTRPLRKEWADSVRAEGYSIFRMDVEMPPMFDESVETLDYQKTIE